MATQHHQNQEQDDLMAAFDAPIKEVENLTFRGRGNPHNIRSNIDINIKKEVNKATLKSNFCQESEKPKAYLKSSRLDRTMAPVEKRLELSDRDLASSDKEPTYNEGITQIPANDGREAPDCFSSEPFNVLVEEIQTILNAKAGVLRNVWSVNELLGKLTNALDVMYTIPKYQEKLKYITALTLVFYGGSWTFLAGIIAAVEVFGTGEVIGETFKICDYLVSEEFDNEHEVSPGEMKQMIRKMALHFTLMVAVVKCPSLAEICISIAVACKFSPLVSADELLKKILNQPEVANMKIDDYFSLVDPEWFDLLSLVGCNIISVILFGCFPRLITAMFMGYFGCCLLSEGLKDGVEFIPNIYNGSFDESFWLQKTTQFYVWALVALTSVWQAMNGYSGDFGFIAWCMFLYPVARICNTFIHEPKCPEGKRL